MNRSGDRAYFPIIAKCDLEIGEEIIVNYGLCYWKSIADYQMEPKEKPKSVQARDNRLLARQQRLQIQVTNVH
mgnify:FL=1